MITVFLLHVIIMRLIHISIYKAFQQYPSHKRHIAYPSYNKHQLLYLGREVTIK